MPTTNWTRCNVTIAAVLFVVAAANTSRAQNSAPVQTQPANGGSASYVVSSSDASGYANCSECDDEHPCEETAWCFLGHTHGCIGRLIDEIHAKFNYFCPSGAGGQGVPWFDCYHMVYAVNPEYFDPRDGRVYAAQDTGVPMAVPLAPNVNYTYNYGWGIPSSRITPISRFYPEYGYIGRSPSVPR
jgi:hypothetical protein